MKTIQKAITRTEVIKKSKFIVFLHPINSKNEANNVLKQIREQYNDATHVCYAYILDENEFKYSDDGEPQNTAGMPIYKALSNKSLTHIFCAVVRYFGGTKLGANGLVHAYSDSTLKAIENSQIIDYKEMNSYLIELSYDSFDSFNHYLSTHQIDINDKQFLEKIFVSISTDEENITSIRESFPNIKITII